MVSPSGLIHRLRSGWNPEEAISAAPATRGQSDVVAKPVRAFGITQTVTAWSRDRRCKVTATTPGARLKRGIPPEAAITVPPFDLHK